jgi:hypothetical protein
MKSKILCRKGVRVVKREVNVAEFLLVVVSEFNKVRWSVLLGRLR